MKRLCLPLLPLLLAACAAPAPHGRAAVGPDGTASAAVTAGAITVGGGPGGAHASARVVDTRTTDVTVGTHGASVSVRPLGSAIRLSIGTGGVGIGF
ncbi:hypothetical protein [Rhodovulum sp. P5]|uniref:hypothetical protein n=1 Tax=Rhodovulum sp. P5 TaxID=1564506 RepID=UPI0009DA7262|nr:hypothetical protein [Rhodovulum sp. P5]